MLLQFSGNGLDICLDLAVLGLHLLHPVGAFFEESEKALLLFFHVEVLELRDERGDHASHFAQVLGLDAFQSLLGKVRHLLLGSHAVSHDRLCVLDIDLLYKSIDHFDLFRCENSFFRLSLGSFLLCRRRGFLHRRLGLRFSERKCRRCGCHPREGIGCVCLRLRRGCGSCHHIRYICSDLVSHLYPPCQICNSVSCSSAYIDPLFILIQCLY